MANNSYAVSAGDDLYRVAAILYGDAKAWTLLARANGLYDPVIQADAVLSVPDFNAAWVNDGILASQ
jgi:hypothetical protein